MEKISKKSLTAVLLMFAMLLTACSGNNAENEANTAPEIGTSTQAENISEYNNITELADTVNDVTEPENTSIDTDKSEPDLSSPAVTQDWEWPDTTQLPYLSVSNDTPINYQMTDEDKEVRGYISELFDDAKMFVHLYYDRYEYALDSSGQHYATLGSSKIYDTVRIALQSDEIDGREYLWLSLLSMLSFSTKEELEAGLKNCFSEEIAEEYWHVGRVETVSEEDGCYTVRMVDYPWDDESYIYLPDFIEWEGKLYGSVCNVGGWYAYDIEWVRVLSRTDDEIVFAYVLDAPYELDRIYAGKGVLKYENGWKLDWFCNQGIESLDFYETFG